MTSAPESVLLSSGQSASIVVLDDGWALEIDGFRQSHVGDDAEPSPHATVRWMLAALSGPLARQAPRIAHLGGAAMSLPRQVAHARPAAEQVAVELERAIVDLVVAHAPPPAGVSVAVGDARAWLDAAPAGALDAIAIDVYAGGRIPPAFTSLECAVAARAALAPGGLLVVNGVAGPELAFTAAHLAALEAAFGHAALIVQGSVLAGARFGNAVLLASAEPIPPEPIRAALAGDASRGAFVGDVSRIVGDIAPLRDADARWSPEPIRAAFIPPAD
ncbi:spermidine synthase [Agrococcus jejuensis]|uniref:spermidine synthase n=1 Tax=Agrococcus jejuensis TaxID=399736 RepID=UPI0011A85ADB|nr:fused MFS/spermidine synthase [Agrococcus jejuensis]